jgi:hypothetical protein
MGKGTSTSTQTQQSQLSPYDPAASRDERHPGQPVGMAPGAASLDPTSAGAINKVISNADGTPNYSAPIQAGTYGLLNGGGATANNGAIENNLAIITSGWPAPPTAPTWAPIPRSSRNSIKSAPTSPTR